ncbi:MAG: HAD hydrolase family protein [Anaeroplasmataceae bacterium]|nr:HAD hydrolase family protein [Anaeroplasmataceae bacterium]
MEIYLDLEKTLLNDANTLSKDARKILTDLSLSHSITILSTAWLWEIRDILDIPNIQIVSTVENKLYANHTYDYAPLELNHQMLLPPFKGIYTLYAVLEDTCYVVSYQERLKNFYPGKKIKLCSQFPKEISSFIAVLYQKEEDSFLNKITNYSIQTLASDAKKKMLLITKNPSTKASWLKKLKKSPAIGIGDSISDYEFIGHCEVQVAMENADEELKKLCKYQTPKSNQENGALDFILSYLKHQQA